METKRHVTISPPNFQMGRYKIVGTAPYVQHKFSQKAREQLKEQQEAGSTARSKRKREAKNFQEHYEQAQHISHDGWVGIPASAFRKAMISACKIVGFHMSKAKLAIFIEADGFDRDENTPLVKITKGEPEYFESLVRIQQTIDIHPRPLWQPGWEAILRVRWDADLFTETDIANLLMRAGLQVGIGEGRPDSKDTPGMGWGIFEMAND